MCKGCDERVCKNCRWFDVMPDEEDPREGWYVRFPPTFVGRPYHDGLEHEDAMNTLCWANPRVGIMATCGEWTERGARRDD